MRFIVALNSIPFSEKEIEQKKQEYILKDILLHILPIINEI